jgi:hypothetical protein
VNVPAQKYQGGGGVSRSALIVGLLFTVLALIGLKVSFKAAMFSYLVAFAYWAGVALSSLLLLMIFHAFRAKWMVVAAAAAGDHGRHLAAVPGAGPADPDQPGRCLLLGELSGELPR